MNLLKLYATWARLPQNVKLTSDRINKPVITSQSPPAARYHVLCAGSSVIPGCGVLTTLGGIAGYGESRRLFWWWIPPTKWGKNPSPRWSPVREKTGWPVGEMIVESINFFINNYCWARWTTSDRFRLGLVHISSTFNDNPCTGTRGCQRCLLLSWPLFRGSRLRILINSL